jgi:hypothetical protein
MRNKIWQHSETCCIWSSHVAAGRLPVPLQRGYRENAPGSSLHCLTFFLTLPLSRAGIFKKSMGARH